MSGIQYRIKIIPRTLQFKQPAGTSRGIYRTRQVWYVCLRTDDGFGVGECAPLYDLSPNYDATYESRLQRVCRDIERSGTFDPETLRDAPSMRFGLETAFLSEQASRSGDFLKLFDTPFSRGEEGTPINGLVWMGTFEEMQERMRRKLADGFRCIKIKVGAIDFEREVELIRSLRERFPKEQVQLRLDANGGFPIDEALGRLQRLSAFDIHSIEQPIRQKHWPEMRRLADASPIPIALDEELIGVHTKAEKERLLARLRPAYLVLKPTLHGGIAGCREWIRLADERGIPYWLTSALESNVGLNAIAQFQSTLPQSSLHQGLGTGSLFVKNFEGTRLEIRGEQLWRGSEAESAFAQALRAFREEWDADTPTMLVRTSGSTGTPKTFAAEKQHMRESARRTCDFLRIPQDATALLCLPLEYIAGKMMAVRAFLRPLRLLPVLPSSHPFQTLRTAPYFAALTPMQAYNSLTVPRERRLLRATRCLLLGGGAISPELEAALRDFPNEVWSSYGMAETLSHVALRRLNGPHADEYYTPLEGVSVALNAAGCLQIYAPSVCRETLQTHDLAEVLPDERFRLLGRADNIVVSGGLKFQLEQLEARLQPLPVPFLLTSVPDASLGEALTLLLEGEADDELRGDVLLRCRERLPRHAVPRHVLFVEHIPHTISQKPARAEARKLAVSRIKTAK